MKHFSIIKVALPIPLRRVFDYKTPSDPLNPSHSSQPPPIGARVQVNFRGRPMIGVVVDHGLSGDIEDDRILEITSVIDHVPILDHDLMQLCHWTARYYVYSLGETIFGALPPRLRKGLPLQPSEEIKYKLAIEQDAIPSFGAKAPKQHLALQEFQSHPEGLTRQCLKNKGIELAIFKALLTKQLIIPYGDKIDAINSSIKSSVPLIQPSVPLIQATDTEDKVQHPPIGSESSLVLSSEQKHAISSIIQSLGQFKVYLLDGITASGKTEVYFQVMQRVLDQGGQVLILIPEINLSPQTGQRLQERFNVAVITMHSQLSENKRLQAWRKAYSGEAKIILGTRSAVFTPLPHLGLIVVDEEHDGSFKQQEGLRYHARDLSVVRAQMRSVPVILGSATPSLESIHNTQIGRYQQLCLTSRVAGALMPSIQSIDLRNQSTKSGLSDALILQMQQTLNAGQQCLLFLNRRGFAPVLMCKSCQWVSKCPHCDCNMVLHQKKGALLCHYCSHIMAIPKHCPKCQLKDLQSIGVGTEQIESTLKMLFPKTAIYRIDKDSISQAGHLIEILDRIHEEKPAILVGTQMLAKGHHFPAVTLVGVLDADNALFSADFRATEHLAQLLVQVSGRAGRGKYSGRVMIQTQCAQHPVLQALILDSYATFANQILTERHATQLPPYTAMAIWRAEAHTMRDALEFLNEVKAKQPSLKSSSTDHKNTILNPSTHNKKIAARIIGAFEAPMPKRAGYHRAQLIIIEPNRTQLHRTLTLWMTAVEQIKKPRHLRWSLDVDPMDLF